MKFKTHNDETIDICGTSLAGYVDASFSALCKVFGEPTVGDEYKVDAEWMIKFDNGEVASIYNYKDGKNYNGDDGYAVEDIRNWHIGGNKDTVTGLVGEALSDTLAEERKTEREPIGATDSASTITLPCFGIVVNMVDGGGSIESDMHETDPEDDPDEEREQDLFNAAVDGIESIILAHAVAGVDIESPAYIEGIETAYQAAGNIS